jgi:hypothetical protein
VLEAGMGALLRKMDEQFALTAADMRSKYKGKETFGGRSCHKFVRYAPQKPQYYCWKAEILIDEEFCFPVSCKFYNWQQEAIEEYYFTDMELNPEYTDAEFEIHAEKEPPKPEPPK